MVPQSYELSYVLSILIIVVCMVLVILAVNLMISAVMLIIRWLRKLIVSSSDPNHATTSTSDKFIETETEISGSRAISGNIKSD